MITVLLVLMLIGQVASVWLLIVLLRERRDLRIWFRSMAIELNAAVRSARSFGRVK
jgi:hypothetical protein